MTTSNQQSDPSELASRLSAAEITALEMFAKNYEIDRSQLVLNINGDLDDAINASGWLKPNDITEEMMFKHFWRKALLETNGSSTPHYRINELGLAVLASLHPPAVTQADILQQLSNEALVSGLADESVQMEIASADMATQAEGDKPTTITWGELMTRGNKVFSAWLVDQCELLFEGQIVTNYDYEDKEMVFTKGGMYPMRSDIQLTVIWLPTNGSAGTAGDAEDYIRKAQAENAALRETIAGLLEVAKFFIHGYWTTVYIGEKLNQLTIHTTDEQLEEFRAIVAKALAAANGEPKRDRL